MTIIELIEHPVVLRSALVSRAMAVGEGRGDEDNIRWFVCLVALAGWPDRRLVGRDGAAAALSLADRAPLPYRACWAAKVTDALQTGTVPAEPARAFLVRVLAERIHPGLASDWSTT